MKFKVDPGELTRKLKRFFDGNWTYRKIFILIFITALLLLYVAPNIFRWIFVRHSEFKGSIDDVSRKFNYDFLKITFYFFLLCKQDPLLRCIDDRLTPFYHLFAEYDAHIQHKSPLSPPFINEKDYIPYVGNGIFALEIHEKSHLNIKSGRALTQPLYFHPIVSISTDKKSYKESSVVEYSTGIVYRCDYYL